MKQENLGKCYKLGFEYLLMHPNYILVHGYITNKFSEPFQTIDHCWLVKDDVIYDPVHEKEYPKFMYETVYDAESEKEYTIKQAMELAYKTEHYGCWHTPRELNSEQYYEGNKLKREYL